jgi:hypothetical protein
MVEGPWDKDSTTSGNQGWCPIARADQRDRALGPITYAMGPELAEEGQCATPRGLVLGHMIPYDCVKVACAQARGVDFAKWIFLL